MKTLFRRVTLSGIVLGLLACVGYLLAIIALTDNPRGKYASYEFHPHASTDVLRFQDGKVTLETCCGDQAYGIYTQDDSGQWIWTHQYQKRPADRTKWHLTPPRRFALRRSLFSLQIEALDPPALRLGMRARLFIGFPL
jgi:hypothetical protein